MSNETRRCDVTRGLTRAHLIATVDPFIIFRGKINVHTIWRCLMPSSPGSADVVSGLVPEHISAYPWCAFSTACMLSCLLRENSCKFACTQDVAATRSVRMHRAPQRSIPCVIVLPQDVPLYVQQCRMPLSHEFQPSWPYRFAIVHSIHRFRRMYVDNTICILPCGRRTERSEGGIVG